MTYVTTLDVEQQIQEFSFTANSYPSKDDVEAFIIMIEAELNGMLSTLGVTVPINDDTSPESFQVVKLISLQGVLAMTLGALHSLHTSEQSTRETSTWERFEKWTNALIKNPTILRDAVRETTIPINETVTVGNQWYDKESHFPLTEFTKWRNYRDELEMRRSKVRVSAWRTELR